ncbi:MAG: hypothetical protein QM488_08955 [Rhizobiaceae bacterium]
MDQDFNLGTYLNILKRRYIVFLFVMMSVFSVVCVIAYLLPREYLSQATILVESQQIPNELARTTITANAVERVQVIKQRLTTRNNLLDIAREFKLFSIGSGKVSPSEIVDEMRHAAQIEQLEIGGVSKYAQRGQVQTIAFTVSFNYTNPVVAARVANKFVELILEQNIQARRSRATETFDFFEEQQQIFQRDLAQLETRIVNYKNENSDALPESLAFRRNLQAELQSEILGMDRNLGILTEERKVLISRARESLKGVVINPNSALAELTKLRTQLARLEGLYSNQHPNIKRISTQISALESLSKAPETPQEDTPQNISDDELATNQLVDPQTANQIRTIDRQITLLDGQKLILKERVDSISGSIKQTAKVDVALNVLLREHENLRKQLTQAKENANAAAIGKTLEDGRQAERFEVIEQATAPDQPTKPNRPAIVLAGLFGSIGSGIGIVILLEMMSQIVRGSAGLRRKLEIEPISTIPYIATATERRLNAAKSVSLLIVFVALVVGALAAIQIFYLPLDLVAERIMDGLGLTQIFGL